MSYDYGLHKETYTHPDTGRTYEVAYWIDMDSPPPGTDDDGHGVLLNLSFDPTDPEQVAEHEDGFSTEFVMSAPLMRRLNASYRGKGGAIGVYYDFVASMNKAVNVWGCKQEYAEKVVEEDFEYLKGWYDDKWYWIGMSVCRADEDDPWHDTPLSISGFESLILDDDKAKREIIEEMVFSLEADIRRAENKGQLSLPLV